MTSANSTSVLFTTDAHNDRYREASRRLADRAAAIRERFVAELAMCQSDHELDWRSLLASQRRIAEDVGAGAPPDVERFWREHAQPRSQDFIDACLTVVDAHLLLLWDAVSVFVEGAQPALSLNGAPPSDSALLSLRNDVERLIAPVSTIALDRRPIDSLGERWQQRLRRQAVRRYTRSGGVTDVGCSAAIDELELKMMSQAPWAHADQLLSAYELAHGEIRRSLADRIERLLSDLLTS